MAPLKFRSLTFHWNAGADPPLTGVAVKVTGVPIQTDPVGFAPIVTPTGIAGVTLMITEFEVAGLLVVQLATDVTMHVTASLFDGIYEYVELDAPETFTPFTFH